MEYTVILRLNKVIPDSFREPGEAPSAFQSHSESSECIISPLEQRMFQWSYNEPAFGWKAAREIYLSGVRDFPLPPEGPLKWVFRAWLLQRYPKEYLNHDCLKPVRAAWLINAHDDNRSTRDVLRAALITHDMDPKSLGVRMGMDPEIMEAFDTLFWNVYHRRKDHMFLRNLVYPNSRLEEYCQDYATRHSLGKHLLRIGYNKDIKNVLFWAGFRQETWEGMDAQQASALFKKSVLVQGLMLAENGFLNYTKHHPTVISAKSIIQANLIGGNDAGGEGTMGTFSEFAMNQIENDSAALESEMRRVAGLS